VTVTLTFDYNFQLELDLDNSDGLLYLDYQQQMIKPKFHYAMLVAERSEAGRRPVADLLARATSLLAS